MRFQKSRALLVLAGLVGIWWAFTAGGVIPATFLPAPDAVVVACVQLFLQHNFLYDMGASIYRVMAGFIIAAFIAVPLGVWIGSSRRVEWFFEPVIGFFRYLPVPALVPLCILWIGIGNAEKIAVIFLGTFFQLTILVADATRAVPGTYLDLSATLGLSRRQQVAHVLLPGAMAGIYDALRVSMGWAWSYLVVAELVAATSGIGHVIIESQRYLKTSEVFAGVLVIGLIGVLYDQAFNLMRRVFFPWTMRRN